MYNYALYFFTFLVFVPMFFFVLKRFIMHLNENDLGCGMW